MWYVIVSAVSLVIGGCFGLLIVALCTAASENDAPGWIEYRNWNKWPEDPDAIEPSQGDVRERLLSAAKE